MHYWKISLKYSDVYWSSSLGYSLSSVPREAAFDGHLLSAFIPMITKVEKISKEQYNEFMVD